MCTRAVYMGSNDLVITGRTMDWPEDQHSNAWVFPRGMTRNGAAGARSVRWTCERIRSRSSFRYCPMESRRRATSPYLIRRATLPSSNTWEAS